MMKGRVFQVLGGHGMEAQIIKNIVAKYIYKRGAGRETSFLIGVLDFRAGSAQRPKLGPCVWDWDNSLSSCCVSVAGAVWGTSPQCEYLHVEASGSLI